MWRILIKVHHLYRDRPNKCYWQKYLKDHPRTCDWLITRPCLISPLSGVIPLPNGHFMAETWGVTNHLLPEWSVSKKVLQMCWFLQLFHPFHLCLVMQFLSGTFIRKTPNKNSAWLFQGQIWYGVPQKLNFKKHKDTRKKETTRTINHPPWTVNFAVRFSIGSILLGKTLKPWTVDMVWYKHWWTTQGLLEKVAEVKNMTWITPKWCSRMFRWKLGSMVIGSMASNSPTYKWGSTWGYSTHWS